MVGRVIFVAMTGLVSLGLRLVEVSGFRAVPVTGVDGVSLGLLWGVEVSGSRPAPG